VHDTLLSLLPQDLLDLTDLFLNFAGYLFGFAFGLQLGIIGDFTGHFLGWLTHLRVTITVAKIGPVCCQCLPRLSVFRMTPHRRPW